MFILMFDQNTEARQPFLIKIYLPALVLPQSSQPVEN